MVLGYEGGLTEKESTVLPQHVEVDGGGDGSNRRILHISSLGAPNRR